MPNPDLSVVYEEAIQAHQQDDFDGAEAGYLQILEQKPGAAHVHYLLGTVYLSKRSYDIAKGHLITALSTEQKPGYQLALGHAHRLLNELEDARNAYCLTRESDLGNREAIYFLGITLTEMCEYDTAEIVLRCAQAIKKDSRECATALGEVFRQQKKLSEAKEVFESALSLEPDCLGGLIGMGQTLIDAGDEEAGGAVLKKAISLYPNHHETHLSFGDLFRRQDKLDWAASAYNSALELHPRCIIAWINLGITLKSQSKSDEALNAFKKANDLNPNDPRIRPAMGELTL